MFYLISVDFLTFLHLMSVFITYYSDSVRFSGNPFKFSIPDISTQQHFTFCLLHISFISPTIHLICLYHNFLCFPTHPCIHTNIIISLLIGYWSRSYNRNYCQKERQKYQRISYVCRNVDWEQKWEEARQSSEGERIQGQLMFLWGDATWAKIWRQLEVSHTHRDCMSKATLVIHMLYAKCCRV